MRKAIRLVSMIICLACCMAVEARGCGTCHGNGIRRVFVATGSYGVSGGSYRQCPHCGQSVSSSANHYCFCTTCGGSGEVGGSSSRGGSSMLYPAEAQSVQILMELLNYGEAYYPACSVCNGTGQCPQCQGASRYSYYDWNTGLTYGGCIPCGSSGICPTCKGGKTGPKQYRPISEQQRANCINMLRSIIQTAAKRTQR